MTVMLLAICDSGVGMRVAVTTKILRPSSSAGAAQADCAARAAGINAEKSNRLRTGVLLVRGQEPARVRLFEHGFFNRKLRDDDSNTVVATVSPAVISAPRPVTGRRREAGFLAPGSLLSSAFPKRCCFSGLVGDRYPVTVAGAAAVFYRVPI